MIKLVISDNEGTTTVVPLVRDEVSIGRKEGNTIRLTERNISREHCRIQRSNGSYVIHDLGSYNGVVINGQRIAGEAQVKPGDEIRIGDYTLLLQAETADSDKPTGEIEVDPTRVLAAVPRTPARLVVLTPPVAGAEFSLPERGELRIGRAPELDVTLDHRSVSREHARLACDADEVRVIDRGSVNGVVVNGEKVSEARLAPGDVLELGDVLLRFVGAGEQYVFDPAEARTLTGRKRARGRLSWPLVAAVASGVLLLAIVIMRSGPGDAPVPAAAAPAGTAAAAVVRPEPAPDPHAADAQRVAGLVKSCRDANLGGRFAEAVAHANAALKLSADAAEALACQEAARVNHEQEQIFVRGKAALEAKDYESALKELSSLSQTSVVRNRPEVAQALALLAEQRLDDGDKLLRKQPEQAVERAQQAMALAPASEATQARAQALIARAEAARTPARPAARPEPIAPVRRSSAEPRPKPAAGDRSPMEAASACLARGDNPCVIRALSGRAQTAQELGLLIETYRAMGETPAAYRNMQTYVQRFPTARRAEAYRQMLERRSE